MARHALIIDHVTDVCGDPWDVRERRQGPAGPEVLIGWPEGHRGKGCGGVRVIPTPELAAYLHEHCRRGGVKIMERELPIGRGAIKRLRRLLDLDQDRWWIDRERDLASMTGAEFAATHGVQESTASLARQRYLRITRQRPYGWWRQPKYATILRSDKPRAWIADKLGISIGAVGRLRWMLKQ